MSDAQLIVNAVRGGALLGAGIRFPLAIVTEVLIGKSKYAWKLIIECISFKYIF